MRLVLWDIDGTLVQAGEVGRDIFTEAFQAGVGRAPDRVAARALAMAGRTDPEIALEFLAAHEVAERERHLPAFSRSITGMRSSMRTKSASPLVASSTASWPFSPSATTSMPQSSSSSRS